MNNWIEFPSSSSLQAREGHTAVTWQDSLIVYGGSSAVSDNSFLGDMWSYSTTSMTWSEVITGGTSPLPRSHHVATVQGSCGVGETGCLMVIYGGSQQSPTNGQIISGSELWVFDLDALTWNQLAYSTVGGTLPNIGLVLQARGSYIYIFGGYSMSTGSLTFTNKVYSLCLSCGGSYQWIPLTITSAIQPSPRSDMAGVIASVRSPVGVDVDHLVVFGGRSRGVLPFWKYYNDVWALNMVTMKWTTISNSSLHTVSAYFHSMNAYKQNLFVFGGLVSTGTVTQISDTLLKGNLTFINGSLTLGAWERPSNGPRPDFMFYHSGDIVSNTLYIYGGRGLLASTVYGNLWTRNLSDLVYDPLYANVTTFGETLQYDSTYDLVSESFLLLSAIGIIGLLPIILFLRRRTQRRNSLSSNVTAPSNGASDPALLDETELRNKGASPKEIQKSTTVLSGRNRSRGKVKDELVMNDCSICLCEIVDEEVVRRLPCAHIYHQKCIDEWLLGNRMCPMCKHEITSPHPKSPTRLRKGFNFSPGKI